MPDNLNIDQQELTLEPESEKKIRPRLRHLVYLIAVIAAVYCLNQLFFMVRLTAGITSEKPAPKYFTTLEIVNASGTPQISKNVTEKLNTNIDQAVELVVINTERLEYKNFEKTLVISRDENTEAAVYVAKAIGLAESEVVFRPAIESDLAPKVTLVLGEDIEQVLNPQKPTKES